MSQLTQLLAVAALAGGMYAIVQSSTPPPKPGAASVATSAKPVPTRTSDHRKVHRPAPKVAKRKWEPIPGVRPIPPIAKEERRRERPKVKAIAKTRMPSCAYVRQKRASMTLAEQLAAYSSATPEQVAHGRRCLGL